LLMSHALVFLEATWSKILEGEANQLKERLLSEALILNIPMVVRMDLALQ
jgi:hypothetical protein